LFYKRKFKVHIEFNQEEVKHWFLPRDKVIYTYVVVKEKKITDFFSFYYLPSSVLKHPKHKTLHVTSIY